MYPDPNVPRNWEIPQKNRPILGGGFKMFQIFFIFTPTWGNDPFWRAYFSDGWFNHQLAYIMGSYVFFSSPRIPRLNTIFIPWPRTRTVSHCGWWNTWKPQWPSYFLKGPLTQPTKKQGATKFQQKRGTIWVPGIYIYIYYHIYI